MTKITNTFKPIHGHPQGLRNLPALRFLTGLTYEQEGNQTVVIKKWQLSG